MEDLLRLLPALVVLIACIILGFWFTLSLFRRNRPVEHASQRLLSKEDVANEAASKASAVNTSPPAADSVDSHDLSSESKQPQAKAKKVKRRKESVAGAGATIEVQPPSEPATGADSDKHAGDRQGGTASPKADRQGGTASPKAACAPLDASMVAPGPIPLIHFAGGRFTGRSGVDLRLPPHSFVGVLGGSVSISFTAKWNAFNTWSRVIDFGSGPASDNITITNFEKGKTLVADIYRGTSRKRLLMSSALTVGKSHRYLFTVSDTGCMRMLRDGQLLGELAGGYVPREVERLHLLVGGSNWPTDGGFQGCVSELSVWRGVLEWSAAFPETAKLLSEAELDNLPVVGDGSRSSGGGRSKSADVSTPAAAAAVTETVNATARADAAREVSPSAATKPVVKRKARKSRERSAAAASNAAAGVSEEPDRGLIPEEHGQDMASPMSAAKEEAIATAPIELQQEPTVAVPEVVPPREAASVETSKELPAPQKLASQPLECKEEEQKEAAGSFETVTPVPTTDNTGLEGSKTEAMVDTVKASLAIQEDSTRTAKDSKGAPADEATGFVEAPVRSSKASKKGWGPPVTAASAPEVSAAPSEDARADPQDSTRTAKDSKGAPADEATGFVEAPVRSSKASKKGWGPPVTAASAPEVSAAPSEDARADAQELSAAVQDPSTLPTQVEPSIAKDEMEKAETLPDSHAQLKTSLNRMAFDATASRTPLERDILKWEKKAREIDRLQRRLADGEELEANQLEKIAKSEEVEKRLAELHEQHAAEKLADPPTQAASDVNYEGADGAQETDIKSEDAWPVAASPVMGASMPARTPLRAPPPGKQQWIPAAPEPSAGKGTSMPWQKGKTGNSWEAGCGAPNQGPASAPENFGADADAFGDGLTAQVPPTIPTMDGWMSEGMAGHPPHSLPPTLNGSMDFNEGGPAQMAFMDASGASPGMLGEPDYMSLGPGGPTGPMEVLLPPTNMQFQDRWECCWEWVQSGWCPRGLTCRWEHPQLTPLTYPLYD